MSKLFLKSAKSTGLLDTDSNKVIIKNKVIRLSPGAVISSGDIVTIQGEAFVAMDPQPQFFGDYAHRTAQIIQPWDVSVILFYCGIRPGKNVLESGVGSGALSSAILSAIGMAGSLLTVELDKNTISNAIENVRMITETSRWELVNSDIMEFNSEKKFDAIILDIPEPWNALKKLSKNLVPGGIICCYSPTFNQLEKNVLAMKEASLYTFESMEIMKRSMLVRENATRPDNEIIGHTAFLTFALKLSGLRSDA